MERAGRANRTCARYLNPSHMVGLCAGCAYISDTKKKGGSHNDLKA